MTERLPLPEPEWLERKGLIFDPLDEDITKPAYAPLYTADQMRDYADAENAALRERVKLLEDALQRYVNYDLLTGTRGKMNEIARADADRRHQLLIIQHAEAVELWSALKDLSFECDGVTRCIAPSRETYNRTFAILQRKNHLSSEALRGHGSSGLQQQQQAHGIAAPGSKP